MPNSINGQTKILIIGPSWLGDMVMAQALFSTLKQLYPTATLDVAAPPWSLSILDKMPEVNNKIVLDLPHGKWSLIKRYKLAQTLKKNHYTHAIVLPNSWKSALIPWLANIKQRIGWLGELRFILLNNIRYLNKSIYPKMVERYVALAYSKTHPLNHKYIRPHLLPDQHNINILKQKYNIKDSVPIIALCIGAAFGEAKCWPNKYYLELANIAASYNYQVLLLGTETNLPAIMDNSLIINLSGKISLLDTADLIYLSSIVVCNDSGLMHIAAGFNKKIIAIYGPTSPKFTPPLADNVIILNKNLACSPCFKRICPLKHHNCMHQILVNEVANYLKN